MNANRRSFLIGAITAVGGASMLASCSGEPEVEPTKISPEGGRFYTLDEMTFLFRLCDLLIPETDTPGAVEALVPAYLDGLMMDWANEETRAENRAMLVSLKQVLDINANQDFGTAPRPVSEAALLAFEDAVFDNGAESFGYPAFKQLIATIFGFTELGAELSGWNPVPGYWDPAVQKDYS